MMNLDLMVFFQKNYFPWIKDGVNVINVNDKKVREHTEFHYIFMEMQLHTLIFFGFKCIPLEVINKVKDKSITHRIFRIQDNETIMCEIYFVSFIEYMLP